MMLEKTFFYDRLKTTVEIDDETLKKLDFFEIRQNEKSDSLKIDELAHKTPITGEVLLLCSYEIKKVNKRFLQMEFNNSNGKVLGRMFDNYGSIDRTTPILDKHSVFIVDGSVNEYQGTKSINIDQINPCDFPVNPSALLPSSSLSVKEMLIEMFVYMNDLEEPHRTIALKGLQRYWKIFSLKAAAKGHHHAYIHGLLKHTLGLMRLTRYILKQAPNPIEGMFNLIKIVQEEHQKAMMKNFNEGLPKRYNKLTYAESIDHLYSFVHMLMDMLSANPEQEISYGLLIADEFYHDIGKAFEYGDIGDVSNKFELLYPHVKALKEYKRGGIDMDPLGQLIGHMAPGIMLLQSVINDFKVDISLEDVMNYNHCILAHHGKLEWGANVRPATPEAVIIHFVDYLDSRWESDDEIN